jgi:hypothetical protein
MYGGRNRFLMTTNSEASEESAPVCKTIDSVIATRCIESGFDLLHSDRDFELFATHLDLSVVA